MSKQKNGMTFTVGGMSCAACAARVERAVAALPEAEEVSVNLLTATLRVRGEISAEAVVSAVSAAGYTAKRQGEKTDAAETQAAERKKEGREQLWRFLISLGILLPLMWISMGGMLGLPRPRVFDENPAVLGLTQLLLAGAVLLCERGFFVRGARGAWHRAPNMDTLVALGSGVSFLYSTGVLFAILTAMGEGDVAAASHLSHGLYFESAAMILVLISLGKMLEARAKGKSTDAIRALLSLAPDTCVRWQDGREERVPVSDIRAGDIVLLRPGERVPVDGEILFGGGAFDESALTGESLPVDKGVGDRVFAAAVSLTGTLRVRATGVGEDTALGRIVAAVKDASATKAPIARLADRVAGVFVPVVIFISIVTFSLHLILGAELSAAVGYAISVLVISCPCALGLATPVAIMVGSGKAARHGILFKTAASLEKMGRVRTVLLDKTGTLTTGALRVTDVLPAEGVEEARLLSVALSLEMGSEHPLGRAVVAYAEERGLSPLPVSEFVAEAGRGVRGVLDGVPILGGKSGYAGGENTEMLAAQLGKEGKTALFFRMGEKPLGALALADTLKEDSAEALRQLRKMGIRTCLLTGDRSEVATAVAAGLAIDEVRAGLLPEEKAAVVTEYAREGATVMVGDGINDAPALTAAHVGVAMGAGTDIAIEAADVVLSGQGMLRLADAIALSRKTMRVIKENLFWAFFYNIICIPLAAGALVPLFGWHLSPMVGAAAMSVSSLTVVSNALRLRGAKMTTDIVKNENDNLHRCDSEGCPSVKEGKDKTMQITLKIEGMMCPHCEARVRDTLLAVAGVTEAAVSHTAGTAVVSGESLSGDALAQAVTGAGYTVTAWK